MITIPYTDSALGRHGRWEEKSSPAGIQTAWQGGQLRFQVSGTTQVVITASILSQGYASALAINIDNGDTYQYAFFPFGETHNGMYSVTHVLPDTNAHTIIIKTSADMPLSQYAGTAAVRITEIQIDDGATITAYPAAIEKTIMVIGDSWLASWSDWPRLMNSKYGIYPVSFGGANAAQLDSYFPYKEVGVGETDPAMDAVIISSGVNDYNGGVTTAAYKISVGSLIDKVRASNATAPIILLQTPRNVVNSLNFDQYGTVSAELAAEKMNVVYWSTATIWDSLTWSSGYPNPTADLYHLSFAGRNILAVFTQAHLDALLYTTIEVPAVFRLMTGNGEQACRVFEKTAAGEVLREFKVLAEGA